MYDLIIKNGLVANEHDVLPFDVAVKDEKIAALGVRGQFDGVGAEKVIDAAGKYVVPGGVDAHVHYDLAVSEAMTAQTPVGGSRAGLYGGTTTYIDFSMATGDQDLLGSIQDKIATTDKQDPHSDYALHAIMTGEWPHSNAEQIKDAISGGVVSFKFFTAFRGSPTIGGLMSDDGRIYEAMLETEKHGGITMVHCEDECIIDTSVRRLYREGREQFWNIGEARPALAEEAAVRRMLLLSKRTGSPLYIVHVSAKESVEAIVEARTHGVDVFAEVLHPNLVFDPELYKSPHGQRYMNYPPNKSIDHRDALWDACANGSLHTMASDDFTIPLDNKLAGDTVDNVTGGTNSVETRMSVFWSEGVAKRNLAVTRFVDMTAAAPAKLFGIYGTKGVIRPGADADIVVFDPDRKHTYKQGENLHSECDYSNWDSWEVNGFPETTILRGHVMVHDDQWVGPEGIGRFVKGSSPENL
ncbi:amidohydrolase family protein [Nocardioides marmotae]|uniref:amidohydrolase family protein n=1 Tax=Nocardioides marmotae TaxID=2663857 RepID=UPI0012B672BB|nr:amidohydrolase family protein [Nocardioides marmotae]MBC9732799.1 amidohydrolase family protein [Nocardioides marmotae]MTB83913.1 amidohydrolase family protein [Nocardioides marmotae]